MPKATLKFNLPEEEEEFRTALEPWKALVQEFDNWLRVTIKHNSRDDWPDLEEARAGLHEEAAARNLVIFD